MFAETAFLPCTDGRQTQVTDLAEVVLFLHPGITFPFAKNVTLPSIFAVATIFVGARNTGLLVIESDNPVFAGYLISATPDPPAPVVPPLQQPDPPPPPPLFAVPENAVLFPTDAVPPPPNPPVPGVLLAELFVVTAPPPPPEK